MFEILLWTVIKCKESFLFVSTEQYIFVNLGCSLGAQSLNEFDTAFPNHLNKGLSGADPWIFWKTFFEKGLLHFDFLLESGYRPSCRHNCGPAASWEAETTTCFSMCDRRSPLAWEILGSLRYGDYGLRTTAGRALSFVRSTGLSRANVER